MSSIYRVLLVVVAAGLVSMPCARAGTGSTAAFGPREKAVRRVLAALVDPVTRRARGHFTGYPPVYPPAFWQLEADGRTLVVREGVSPSAALAHRLAAPAQYANECATEAVAVLTLIYAGFLEDQGMNPADRDHRLSGLTVGPWRSTPGIPIDEIVPDGSPGGLEKLLLPGDGIRFVAHDARPSAQLLGTSTQNAIYLGLAEAEGPRWDAGERVFYVQIDGLTGEKRLVDSLRPSGYCVRPKRARVVDRCSAELARLLAAEPTGSGPPHPPEKWREQAAALVSALDSSVGCRADALALARAKMQGVHVAMTNHASARAQGWHPADDVAVLQAALETQMLPVREIEASVARHDALALNAASELRASLDGWLRDLEVRSDARDPSSLDPIARAVGGLRDAVRSIVPTKPVGTDGLIRRVRLSEL